MADPVVTALAFIANAAGEGAVSGILTKPMVVAFDAVYKWSFRDARNADALGGLWSGTFKQESGTRHGKYRLVIRLQRKRTSSLLSGRGLLWPASQGSNPRRKDMDPLDVMGTMQGSFLRIDFRNSDENKVQFGTIVGKLSGKRDELGGNFAAASITDQIAVTGSVALKLQKSPLDLTPL